MRELLDRLTALGISVQVNDTNLDILDPNDALTADLIESVKAHKTALLEMLSGASVTAEYVPLEKVPLADDYPLSSIQKRLFFIQQLDLESMAYHLPMMQRLSGHLDVQQLEKAFSKIIEQHESLRTSFKLKDGEPLQQVADQVDFGIEKFQADEDKVDDIISEFIRPFDLDKTPLLRVGLVAFTEPDQYLLMIDMHHIITDGVSQEILISEFKSWYEGQVVEKPESQYKDYVAWQNGPEHQQELAKQKKFWFDELSGHESALDLPYDFTRQGFRRYEGNTLLKHIDARVAGKLKEIAREEQTTLYMLMLSLFNLFLWKITGKNDVVVGSPIAARQHPDVQDMVGAFINTVLFRNYPDGGLTFRTFLKDLTERGLQVLENQDYPYEQLIDELKVSRDPSRNPLFDVQFELKNFKSSTFELKGLTIGPYEEEEISAKLDLALTVEENGDELILTWVYATDVFAEVTINRFMNQFEVVVEAVLANLDVPMADISLLSKAEQTAIAATNQTDYTYETQHVISLIERQVQTNAHQVALSEGAEQINYEELWERSGKVAAYLSNAHDIKEGALVGLLLGQGMDFVIWMLGIIRCGAAYVPIDKAHPAERVRLIVADSGLQLLVSDEDNDITDEIALIMLDQVQQTVEAMAADTLKRQSTEDGLAYVIYTSGSTGKPKGVMVGHASLANYVNWAVAQYVQNQPSSFPLFTSVSFDLTVTSLFVSLATGSELIIYKDIADQPAVHQVFSDNRVEVIKLTPSHLKLVRDSKLKPENLSKVKTLIVGGEELEQQLASDIYQLFGEHINLYNEYGPTEATVGCMIYAFNPADDYRTVPIGLPIYNTQVHILDAYGKPVPAGVIGELYVAGKGLAKGYRNRPALTAEKFIENPFAQGGKLYKTGDLALRQADGKLQFKGRIDDQVKIRGYRIELGEIEQAMASHPAILQSLVLIRERENERYVVAWYQASEELATETIRGYLAERLPAYVVPSYFVQVEAFSLTTNGKLDKNKLPSYEEALAKEQLAPGNELEDQLAEIWAEVLGLEKRLIGARANYFDIGGNSISVLKLITRINETFEVQLNAVEVFSYPTIASFAEFMSRKGENTVAIDQEVDEAVMDGMANLEQIQLLDL